MVFLDQAIIEAIIRLGVDGAFIYVVYKFLDKLFNNVIVEVINKGMNTMIGMVNNTMNNITNAFIEQNRHTSQKLMNLMSTYTNRLMDLVKLSNEVEAVKRELVVISERINELGNIIRQSTQAQQEITPETYLDGFGVTVEDPCQVNQNDVYYCEYV